RALVSIVASPAPQLRRPGRLSASSSAEALAAPARALGVGVVDGEPRALEAVLVVEGRALEEHGARRVDDDLHAVVLGRLVLARHVGVEEHLVAEPGATARAHGHTQREVLGPLLLHEGADLLGCGRGERDHVSGASSGLAWKPDVPGNGTRVPGRRRRRRHVALSVTARAAPGRPTGG